MLLFYQFEIFNLVCSRRCIKVGPSPKYAYISAVPSKELEYFLSNL